MFTTGAPVGDAFLNEWLVSGRDGAESGSTPTYLHVGRPMIVPFGTGGDNDCALLVHCTYPGKVKYNSTLAPYYIEMIGLTKAVHAAAVSVVANEVERSHGRGEEIQRFVFERDRVLPTVMRALEEAAYWNDCKSYPTRSVDSSRRFCRPGILWESILWRAIRKVQTGRHTESAVVQGNTRQRWTSGATRLVGRREPGTYFPRSKSHSRTVLSIRHIWRHWRCIVADVHLDRKRRKRGKDMWEVMKRWGYNYVAHYTEEQKTTYLQARNFTSDAVSKRNKIRNTSDKAPAPKPTQNWRVGMTLLSK
ncbi:hypothetical protein BC832DRAFT_589984 [Gaertneriomyces semiglobifer]|nr:hypothetical protein BC832DRAFT_589984 [Gaertneriomyces semiglobifer]